METVNKKIKHLIEILARYTFGIYSARAVSVTSWMTSPYSIQNTFPATAVLHLLEKGSHSLSGLSTGHTTNQPHHFCCLLFMISIAKKETCLTSSEKGVKKVGQNIFCYLF